MKFDKSSIITISVILVIITGAAYYVWFSNAAQERKFETLPADNVNKAAKQVSLTNLNDNPVSLSEYQGSVLVANLWASWCPFCTQELKDFETVAGEYKDKGVVVVAINRAEPKLQLQSYLNTLMEFENLVILQDKNDTYYKFIGGFSMPETIFYDRAGNVVNHKRGYIKLEEMRTNLDSILNADIE